MEEKYYGTGRRKSSVARVFIKAGQGSISVNKIPAENYFKRPCDNIMMRKPFDALGMTDKFDVMVNVHGGGTTGQSQAILLGIARALVASDIAFKPSLRAGGFLTRDSRRVERKKPGHLKARKTKQFSKR